MKKILLLTAIVLLGIFALISQDSKVSAASQGKIVGLEAVDNPFDDGSGVIVSWKPLTKEHRVIQYRIYRGISPDSLFLLSSLDVDPKLGVLGDKLYFYDKDYQNFFNIENAPGKLRKDKQQDANSPIYAAVPRDPKILEKLIPHYTVLGAIKGKEFYYRSKKVVDTDKTVYAGYKPSQFDIMLANPLPGNKYYYSILAVNEKGKYLPHADIASIVPSDNRPDTTATLFSTYIKDKNQFNFEWKPPAGSSDIYDWQGWLVPKTLLNQYYQDQKLNALNTDESNHQSWQAGAIKVFEMPNDPVHTIPVYYHTVDADSADIKVPANLDDYRMVLGYRDYNELAAYSLGKITKTYTEADKPSVPAYTVMDKKNDKGDTNQIAIGKPISYVTNARFMDKGKRKLLLNYELSANDKYRVISIDFTFFTPEGVNLGSSSEYYMDKAITHTFSPQHKNIHALDIHMKLKLSDKTGYSNIIVTQKVIYSDKFKNFTGGDVFVNGQNLSKLYYDFLVQSRTDMDYFPGKRTNAIIRTFDDTVEYEDVLYKQVIAVDHKTGLMKLSPDITIETDRQLQDSFRASLYKDVFDTKMKDLEKKVHDLAQEEAQYVARPVPDSLKKILDHETSLLSFITKNPAYQKAQNAKSEKAWRKILVKERQHNIRSFSYQMMVTDGKGLFNVSKPYTSDTGSLWTFPTPDWFEASKLPALIGTIILTLLVLVTGYLARRNPNIYIRPIAGLEEIDNAIGRATEMGRPVLFVPGWGELGEPSTISAMMILNQVAKKTAEFDVRLIAPNCNYFVAPLAQEMVKSAYSEVGRPDSFNQGDIFFLNDNQFTFSAGVNGLIIRERAATVFFMGFFNAEALLMTETGNQCGSVQIAGTDAITQVPFFITTCDFTLIGEEYYAASAYMSHDLELISMLIAQDYFKVIIVSLMLVGVILSSLHMNAFINAFPIE